MTSGTQAGDGGQTPANTQSINTFDGDRDQPKDKAGFDELVKRAISNLGDVTVATLITDVKVTVDDRGRLTDVSAPTEDIAAIISNVNLVNGNATTAIAPSLKDDDALRTFHQNILEKAVLVLPDNVKAFASLVQDVIGKIL